MMFRLRRFIIVICLLLPSFWTSLAVADSRHEPTHHTMPQSKKPLAALSKTSPATVPQVAVTTTPFVRNRDVLCVAGCPDGISPPLLVHRGTKPTIVPMLLPVEPGREKWQQHSTAIFCHSNGGCRSRDFYRPRHGYYDSDGHSHNHHRTTVYVIERW